MPKANKIGIEVINAKLAGDIRELMSAGLKDNCQNWGESRGQFGVNTSEESMNSRTALEPGIVMDHSNSNKLPRLPAEEGIQKLQPGLAKDKT